jgi:hypothetical protein
MVDGPLPTPPSVLKQAIRAVPAVKYALGVAGVIAVIAIIRSFKIDLRLALIGFMVMIVFMVILLLFSKLSPQHNSFFRVPAMILTWFSLLLFIASASALFLSVFWGWPIELRTIFAATSKVQSEKPSPGQNAVPDTPPDDVSGEDKKLPEGPRVAPPEKGRYDLPHTKTQYTKDQNKRTSPYNVDFGGSDAQDFESEADSIAIRAILRQLKARNDAAKGVTAKAASSGNDNWHDARMFWETAVGKATDASVKARLESKLHTDTGVTCTVTDGPTYGGPKCTPNGQDVNILLDPQHKYSATGEIELPLPNSQPK